LLDEYNVSSRANFNMGIFNLKDKRSWEWGDVAGREFNDDALYRFTRTVINASVYFRYEF